MDKKELGNRVKLARTLYLEKTGEKLTQQMLAEKIGISRSYMGDIESGRTYPTLKVLNAIAGACNVPLTFFSPDEAALRSFLSGSLSTRMKQDENLMEKFNRAYPKMSQIMSESLDMSDSFSRLLSESDRLIAIPVLGTIRAGEPIAAEQNVIGYEYIPCETAKSGEYFGLKVTGDSMNNSRIFDGDIVLVRRQAEVENGEIAVVLVDGGEATVKRFFKTDSIITLMPDSSNKDYQPRFIDVARNEVKVLGKVVKVIINL